jgi:hypothetical protein
MSFPPSPGPEGPVSQPPDQPWPGWQPPVTDAQREAKPPGTVIGAVVIAFTMAAVALLGGFAALIVAWTGNDGEAQWQFWGSTTVGAALLWGLVRMLLSGLLVWGGFAALQGKTNKVLAFTLAALIVYQSVALVVSALDGSPKLLSIVGLILECIAFWLIRVRQSKEFFSARGGTAV